MKERSCAMKAFRARLSEQSGFTMIELLFAMAILAIGMLAAVALQLNTARNNTSGNLYTQANMLSMSQLEILKNLDLGLLLPGAYNDPGTIDENGQPGGIYSRSWTITDIGVGARALTVVVQWNHRGRTNRVEVSSNTRGNGV
jgi:prepilin-type N-terminal cleavage/methylation domain-containing protein